MIRLKTKSKIASGKLKQEGGPEPTVRQLDMRFRRRKIADMRELNEMGVESRSKYDIRFNAPSPPVNDDNVLHWFDYL